jgi:membrane-bound lytic murein transglycosylase D
MESRPVFAAIGLFFGGLLVGSAGGGSRESSAQAATSTPEPKPEVGPKPAAAGRGLVSAALRKSTERNAPERGLPRPNRSAVRRSEPVGNHSDDPLHGLILPAIPIAHPAIVLAHLRYLTDNYEGRRNFGEAVKRMGRYQEIIAKTMREHGLPPDLAAVALVESGFATDALSPQGALGLWQFMPATARAYGLIVEDAVDERASIWKSTEAAANHLADLYERFRSWDLALAAYNLGYDGLERRLDEAQTDDFWTLADTPDGLPDETASYVPKVLAAALALQNLDELGFGDLEKQAPIDASELEVAGGTPLALVARASATSVRALHELNPEIDGEALPDRGEKLTLHIPRSGASRARVMLPKLADGDNTPRVSDDFDWGKDDVHSRTSRLERTGVRAHIRHRPVKHHEQAAKAKTEEETPKPREPEPEAKAEAAVVEESKPITPPPAPSPAETHVFYRVVPGDSVAQIAATVGLTVDQVLAQAHVSSADQIRVGALLDLRVPTNSVNADRRPVQR